MMTSIKALASLLACASITLAQTFSDCDPTKTASCPPNKGFDQATYRFDFKNGKSDVANWRKAGTGDVTFTQDGAHLTVAKQGDNPELQSQWYIFFGQLEVLIRAAPGQGIISTVVLLSDILDEVDWEFRGGVPDQTLNNYFGKGDTAGYVAGGQSAVANVQRTTHNYTLDWTKDKLTWYVDGTAVRTLAKADALGGQRYPQTPMRIKIGIWAGGDPSNAPGTIEWAGGMTDYSKGPFSMTVESLRVANANPAKSYKYGDQSGSMESIVLGKDEVEAGLPTSHGPAGASVTSTPGGVVKETGTEEMTGTAGITGNAGAAATAYASAGVSVSVLGPSDADATAPPTGTQTGAGSTPTTKPQASTAANGGMGRPGLSGAAAAFAAFVVVMMGVF